jgi:exopolyphosphatase/guanosine-5'-triphosphate,3'-diphosphate pyrophosphatase
MIRSSIDLGTNTCLLLIAETHPQSGEVLRIIHDEARVVRLGQGVDAQRLLHPEAKARTLACLADYSRVVRQNGLDPATTRSVATSQARDARDGAQFFSEVERETGFQFRTLSGDEEAQATFRGGLLPGLDASASVVIDIGGGSTEYMALKGGKSLDLGSVRFTERFLKSDPVQDSEFWACQEAIDSSLEEMQAWRKSLGSEASLVGVAGTCTTLAQWHLGLKQFSRDAIDGYVLTRGDVHRQVEELKWRTSSERCALPGVEKGRADVLLAGALILWRSMERLDFPECRISTRGLRYGVLTLS